MAKIIGIRLSTNDKYPDSLTYYWSAPYESVIGEQAGECFCTSPVLNADGKPLTVGDSVDVRFSMKFKRFYIPSNR